MTIFPKSSALFLAVLFAASSGFAQRSQDSFQEELSYTNDIQPIVKDFCTTCHAGDDPEAGLALTSYKLVREETELGDLLARINDANDPMPEDGLMPRHLRRALQRWAESGFLEKGSKPPSKPKMKYEEFSPPDIKPYDISKQGFEFLERMQGHWVGDMNLMGTKYDWMAFDYRAISPAHVHGIFEGGTIGNLMTSFFLADFRGMETLMAKNGGILNGIYRFSYFVLEDIRQRGNKTTYRFVDAYGGADIMFMELTFAGQSLEFVAYTSRLGLKAPSQHMLFNAKRKRPEIAAAAAKAVGFPQRIVDFKFPDPMPRPTWAEDYPLTSATYIAEEPGKSLMELSKLSKDPRGMDDIPYLSQLKVSIERNEEISGKKLHVYLSQRALTDATGRFIKRGRYIKMELLDTLLLYPELSAKTNEFTFTYLHPGKYFLTVV
ncbi:MAG: hypothetical protein AAF357_04755, partial [Verrucomicrobiota bacterium]